MSGIDIPRHLLWVVRSRPGAEGVSPGTRWFARCPSRLRRNRSLWCAWPALVAVGLLLLSGLASVATAHPESSQAVSAAGSSPAATAEATSGSDQVNAAVSSLIAGLGPAAGQPWSCSSSGVGGAAACSNSATSAPNWSSLNSPPSRYFANLVYDAKGGYVFLFGGLGKSGILGDTWKFVSGSWTRLTPATSPPARSGAAMAYDAKDGYVLLFGGFDSEGFLGDTWTFAGGSWTELTPATSPEARAYASVTYDSKDGYVLLFGGSDSEGFLGDTWTFAGGSWTELTPATSPEARA
ncbi:MAG: kelch repeat-containing protein, partial [Thermoplasmata archaeon]